MINAQGIHDFLRGKALARRCPLGHGLGQKIRPLREGKTPVRGILFQRLQIVPQRFRLRMRTVDPDPKRRRAYGRLQEGLGPLLAEYQAARKWS
jgi:hypothetical protein